MYAATGTLKNIQANTLFIDMIRNSAGSRRGWCWHVRTIYVLKNWLWDWCLYISVWNKGYKGKWIMYILVFSFPLRSCINDSMITEQLPYVRETPKFLCHLVLVSQNQNNLTTKDRVIIYYFYFLDVLEHFQIKSFYKSPLNLSHLYSAFIARPIISFRICNKKVWFITKENDMCLTRSMSPWLTIERDHKGPFGQKHSKKGEICFIQNENNIQIIDLLLHYNCCEL